MRDAETPKSANKTSRPMRACLFAIAMAALPFPASAQDPTDAINALLQVGTSAQQQRPPEQSQASIEAQCRANEQRSAFEAQIYQTYQCADVPNITTTQRWPDTRGLYDPLRGLPLLIAICLISWIDSGAFPVIV